MGSRFAIHVNPSLAHQIRIGNALAAGLPDSRITYNAAEAADVHVVLGPWFCRGRWRDCMYIDRAYWGDPDSISVHWMVDGEKVFDPAPGWRDTPPLEPYHDGPRIWLCDYKATPPHDWTGDVRLHPAQVDPVEPLANTLRRYGYAYGNRTTALVDAAISGLVVVTRDPHSPVYPISGSRERDDWLRVLAWHNWTIDDIKRGAMWKHLSQSPHLPTCLSR